MPELDDIQADGPSYGTRQKAGLLLGPLFFAGVMIYLQRAGLQLPAQITGATVALMATWWITETIPLWATAALPLLAFPLAGLPANGLVLQYLDPINLLFLGGMLIAAAMQQWDLHRRIALSIISRVGTSPRRIVLGFMLATGFVTLWISNTAATIMMVPIGMAVLLKFQEQRGPNDPQLRKLGLALMLGIAYAASIGGIGTKIGTGTNLVFAKQAKQTLNLEIDFVTWLKFGMPVVLIALPLTWLYLVRVAAPLPAEDSPEAYRTIQDERKRLGAMSRGEWAALLALLSAALLWIFRKDIDLGGGWVIPGWQSLWKVTWSDIIRHNPAEFSRHYSKWFAQDFGDAGVALSIGLLLLVLPLHARPLRMALSLKDARRGISWSMLLMLGGGFAMAWGIQESKLSDWITGLLSNVGKLNAFSAILMVCVISTALTEIASNTATASILLPLLAASAEGFGLHPAPLMLAATLSASFGFMLPAGTPPNAIVFSSGYITVPQMARSGLLIDVCGAFLVALVCYFITPWALGL